MALCKSCAAPLPANSNCCEYCGVRNDMDLQDKQDYNLQTQQSERICPVCHIPLQTIDLKINGDLYIERCQSCFGLFFDPGEIEILLDNTVAEASEVNWQLIDNINQERYPTQQKIKYVKCPVCQMLMDRVNFGYRSGVVVDQCRLHGIWLDNGEITHLMEWKKAGGQLGAEQQKLQTHQDRKNLALDLHRDVNPYSYSRQNTDAESDDLLKTLSDVVATLLHHSF